MKLGSLGVSQELVFTDFPPKATAGALRRPGSVWLALEREIMNPAIANSESQVGMAEKEKKEKERDFGYRVACVCAPLGRVH